MAYYSQGHFVKKKKKCLERGQELRLSNAVSTKAAKQGEGCFRVKKAMGLNGEQNACYVGKITKMLNMKFKAGIAIMK